VNHRADDEPAGPSLPSRIRFRKSIEHDSSTGRSVSLVSALRLPGGCNVLMNRT